MTKIKESPEKTLRMHLNKFENIDDGRLYLKKIQSKIKLLPNEYAQIVPEFLKKYNGYCAEKVLRETGVKFYDSDNSERYFSYGQTIDDSELVLAEVVTCISRPTFWGNRGGDIREYYLVNLRNKKQMKVEHFGEVSPEAHFGNFRLDNPTMKENKLRYTLRDVAFKSPCEPKVIEKSLDDFL